LVFSGNPTGHAIHSSNPEMLFHPLEEFPCSQLENNTQCLHSCSISGVINSTSSWAFSTSTSKCVHPLWLSPCNSTSKVDHEYSCLCLLRMTISILPIPSLGWCWVFNVSQDEYHSTRHHFQGDKHHLLHHLNETPPKHRHPHNPRRQFARSYHCSPDNPYWSHPST